MDAISTFLLVTMKISPDMLLAISIGIGFFWGMIVEDFIDILFPASIPQPTKESNSNTESVPENPEPTPIDDCTEEPDHQSISPDITAHDTEKCCKCEKLQAALREWQAAAVKKAMEELEYLTNQRRQPSFDQKNQSEDSAGVNYWRKIYKTDLMRTNRCLTKANQELEDSLAIRNELEHELQLTKNLLQEEQLKTKKVAETSESRAAVMQNDTEELAKPCEKPKQQIDAATSSLSSASVAVVDKDFENESSEAKVEGVEKVYVVQLKIPPEQENTAGILSTEFNQKEKERYQAQVERLDQERDAALADARRLHAECQMDIEKGDTSLSLPVAQASEKFAMQEKIMAEMETQLDAERSEYQQTKAEYERTINRLEKDIKESRAYAKLITSSLVDTNEFWKRHGFLRPTNLKSKSSAGNPSLPKRKLSNMFPKRSQNTKTLEINGKPVEMTEDLNCNYACISKVFWEEELEGPLLEPINYNKWNGNKVRDLKWFDILRRKDVKNKLKWEQVLGFFFAKVKHDGIEYQLPVLVFDKPKTPNFFGRMWLRAFESSDPSFKVLMKQVHESDVMKRTRLQRLYRMHPVDFLHFAPRGKGTTISDEGIQNNIKCTLDVLSFMDGDSCAVKVPCHHYYHLECFYKLSCYKVLDVNTSETLTKKPRDNNRSSWISLFLGSKCIKVTR